MNDDMTLVQEYAQGRSEPAFAALVDRHLDMVYSAALRQTGDASLAQEVAQAVFIILARKSASLGPDTILSAWLYRTARYAAADALKTQRRRQRREQEALMQSPPPETQPEDAWAHVAPLLDEAMTSLAKDDQAALVLRFFENKSAAQIGAAMRVSEEAAQKRVSRALDKLRKFFVRRGVALSATLIAGAVSANSVQAAPVALAKSVTAVAITKGAAASASTLTLIQGALKIMAWTKAKIAIVVGVAVLLAAGTTTITVKEIAAHSDPSDERLWRTPYFKYDVLDKVAPQVTILPTKYPNEGNAMGASGNRWLGIDRPISQIVAYAYDQPYGRVLFDSGDPHKAYDMIANLPQGSASAMQLELKNKLGLVGHPETRSVDVLLLKVSQPNAHGLKAPSGGGYSDPWGHFSCYNQTISTAHPSDFSLAMELELLFGKTVIDQTGLTQKFNIDLKWNGDLNALKQALLDQLGLELVATNMPIEMLVVEKAK